MALASPEPEGLSESLDERQRKDLLAFLLLPPAGPR